MGRYVVRSWRASKALSKRGEADVSDAYDGFGNASAGTFREPSQPLRAASVPPRSYGVPAPLHLRADVPRTGSERRPSHRALQRVGSQLALSEREVSRRFTDRLGYFENGMYRLR